MKNIYVIVQSNPDYAIDWDAFKRPANAMLIFIGNDASVNALEKSDHPFKTIYKVSKFDLDTLSGIFDDIYEVHQDLDDKVTVSSVCEYDVLVCAELRDKYMMEGACRMSIEHFRNKLLMKAVISAQGLRVPKHVVFKYTEYAWNNTAYIRHLEASLGYPMFAKPIDGASSVDTALICNKRELLNWCVTHKDSPRQMEIEEFIDGDLFHCDSVVSGGKILQTLVSQYLHPNAAALQGKPLASMLLQPDAEDYARLKRFAEEVIKCFPDLPDGCTHLEVFMAKQTRQLIFLEIGARPPGGKVPEMYAIHAGVDFRALHHYLSLGIPVPADLLAKLQSPQGDFAAMFLMVNPPRGGLIEGRIEPTIQSEYQIEWKCKEGDKVLPPKSNNDIVGSLLFWNKDPKQLATDFISLNQYAPLQLDGSGCFVAPLPTTTAAAGMFGVINISELLVGEDGLERASLTQSRG